MESQEELRQKIKDLRESYSKLAWNCRMHGARVSRQTVEEYSKRIRDLQSQLV